MIGQSRNISTSDVANDRFGWLMVTGTAGSVVYGSQGGNETTLTNVPVGVWVPVGVATHITSSSTATDFIVA